MNKHIKQLNSLKPMELAKKEQELRNDILEAKRNIAMGNTTNYKSLGLKKRHLARVLTLLKDTQKETK